MKGYVVQVNFDGDIKGEGTFVFIGSMAECNMRTFVANKLRVLALYYEDRFGQALLMPYDNGTQRMRLVQAISTEDGINTILNYGGCDIGNYSIHIDEIDELIDSNDIVLDMEVLK